MNILTTLIENYSLLLMLGCVIIYKPKGVKVSKAELQRAYKQNPDGAGIMARTGKNLICRKGYFTFEDFYANYLQLEQYEMAIHMRIATSGLVDKNNCHPFQHQQLGMVHNGMITIPLCSPNKSDTWHFFQLIKREDVFNSMLKSEVEYEIGLGNKLVFMHATRGTVIYNEQQGLWKNDCWYSNDYHNIPKTKYKNKGKWYNTLDEDKYLNDIVDKELTEEEELDLLEANDYNESYMTDEEKEYYANLYKK